MANISQNVNIEMLEKLPDGTYKRKYPKTRSDTGVTFDEHLAESTQQAHLAKNIGIEDVAGNFVATEVEGAMNELFTNVSDGKNLVGGAITDVDDSVVIPTDPTFGDLSSAISGISTGKKWASGTPIADLSKSTKYFSARGLGFNPTTIIIFGVFTSSSKRMMTLVKVNNEWFTYGINKTSTDTTFDVNLSDNNDGFQVSVFNINFFNDTLTYYAYE